MSLTCSMSLNYRSIFVVAGVVSGMYGSVSEAIAHES